MKTITWEPCDGQHIVYACKVLGGQAFATSAITKEEFNNIFNTIEPEIGCLEELEYHKNVVQAK